MTVKPYKVSVSDETLDDLQQRLKRTRWPVEQKGAEWNYGTNLEYMQKLVGYWQDGFDWRAQEKKINSYANFRAEVDGLGIHFIHEKGKGNNPMPLLLLHGWPSSFLQMLDVIEPLTDPAANGGDAADSFDVIIPSLPGYGFSDKPTDGGGMGVERMADLLAKLMTEELGYKKCAVRGSDIGHGVAQQIGLKHANLVYGLHISGSQAYFGPPLPDLTEAEKKFMEDGQKWGQTESAYARLQATKPQTPAFGLNDSPSGLAAWIIEKFRSWSDCGGDVEKSFSRDELLANIMVYWVTETIGTSFLPYYAQQSTGGGMKLPPRVEVPTAMAQMPKDLLLPPREWMERRYNITRWTDFPSGGHFGEWEEPELMSADIREFFGSLR